MALLYLGAIILTGIAWSVQESEYEKGNDKSAAYVISRYVMLAAMVFVAISTIRYVFIGLENNL